MPVPPNSILRPSRPTVLVQMVNYNAKNIQFNNITLTHALHTEATYLYMRVCMYCMYVCIGMYMYTHSVQFHGCWYACTSYN